MKYSKIISYAKTSIANTEKYKKANVGEFSKETLAYVFSKAILNPKKDIQVKGIKPNPKPQYSKIDGGIGIKNFEKLCQLYINWCEKHNNESPAYLKFNEHKIGIDAWTNATARCIVYYNEHGVMPQKVKVSYKPFYIPPKPQVKPKEETYSEKIYNHFVEKFGKINSIDEALGKVQDRGYGYYYDNKMTNMQVIDNLANPNAEKPNCTDIHQMFWHLGTVMGYDVRAVHVLCVVSGDGHVRLDFNRGNGWFSRDASCVANGGGITDIWCSRGELLAYNPNWFFEDLEY